MKRKTSPACLHYESLPVWKGSWSKLKDWISSANVNKKLVSQAIEVVMKHWVFFTVLNP